MRVATLVRAAAKSPIALFMPECSVVFGMANARVAGEGECSDTTFQSWDFWPETGWSHCRLFRTSVLWIERRCSHGIDILAPGK